MSYSGDIASVLESLDVGTWGGGTTVGTTIFLNHEPPVSETVPANVVTIYLVGGPPDTLDFSGNSYGERPVQIRMRDSDPAALEDRIESLYALWTAWQFYPAYFLRIKAATKPLYSYPTQDSNIGSLFIASFNTTIIRGS